MGRATENAEFVEAVRNIEASESTARLKTPDLVQRMDLLIAACRFIVAHRLERETVRPMRYVDGMKVNAALHAAHDPGLNQINSVIMRIADDANRKAGG